MNESTKKVAVIVVAIAAVCVAIFAGYKFFAPPALETGVTLPSPAKSMAQMEKEKMQREDAASRGGQGATKGGGEPDASGRPPGGL